MCLSFCLGECLCCAAGGVFKCCCCSISVTRSSTVRFLYTVGFVLANIIAWSFSHWGAGVIAASKNKLIDKDCNAECFQYLSVMRVSLAMVIYHATLALVTYGVHDPQTARGRIQNGLWGPKFIVWAGLIVAMFFVPNASLLNYWIAAVVFSVIFILIQAVILVDLAWDYSGILISKWEDTENSFYKWLLIGLTFFAFGSCIALTGLLYQYYAPGLGCGINYFYITFNLILLLVQAFLSILPKVQTCNPKSGVFQASILALYISYLVGSAITNEPYVIGSMECGPKTSSTNSNTGLRTAMQYVGIALALISLGRAALSTGSYQWRKSQEIHSYDDDDGTHVTYSYTTFHLTFVLASFYLASVLTDWQGFSQGTATSDTVLTVGNGMASVWVKIATSWAVCIIYIWTLVAPILLPNRSWS